MLFSFLGCFCMQSCCWRRIEPVYYYYIYHRSENFRLKNNSSFKFSRYKYYIVRQFRNVARIHILIFLTFNFRRSACGRKYFNGENFPIYSNQCVFVYTSTSYLLVLYRSLSVETRGSCSFEVKRSQHWHTQMFNMHSHINAKPINRSLWNSTDKHNTEK